VIPRRPAHRAGARDPGILLPPGGEAGDAGEIAIDYLISPFELESVLLEHEAVAEAAVVPSPDPLRLAVPKAFVKLAPGHPPSRHTALAVLRQTREQLAPYKRIRRLEFHAELPKTISGKIRRIELRYGEDERLSGASDPTLRAPNELYEADFLELKR
jgi:acetyl-CoA synthetase